MIRAVVPHMRARGSGTIVNIGSIGGKIVLPWLTVYSASKYAVGALTEGLRMELRRDGIHAMIVCPGYVLTEFQQRSTGEAPPQVVEGRRFAITAARCAVDIRRGVERDARTIVTPPVGWLLVAVARLLPRAVEARLAQINGTA